ncbi:hypothetical protein Gogos_003718 [Gossypium gossypioides]|uniref:O-methyltransferase C-terminal domain-containing protein n=1 Tax=Gossypium gossypioides TaxID=34282 RepID=A0A7J9CMX0_GOSGO|nr:hypothetical protein [Gossypium gossypioides]
MPNYQYNGLNPKHAKRFNTAMTNLSKIIVKKILEKYNGFQGITTLVDVGGGYGVTLNMIISKYPSIKGINYDLPHVVQQSPSFHGNYYVGGDTFSSVPKADTIMMKADMHGYIALEEKGKVIVISYMMFEEEKGNAAKFISQMDLHIATGFGGKRFEPMAMDLTFQAFNSSALFSMWLCHGTL